MWFYFSSACPQTLATSTGVHFDWTMLATAAFRAALGQGGGVVGVVRMCCCGSVSQLTGAEVVRATCVVLWEAVGPHYGKEPVRVEHHQCWHVSVHPEIR